MGAGAGAGAGASLPCWSGLMTNAIFTFFPPKGMHITQTSMLSWRLARSEGGKETCMYASGWQCLIATRSHATNFGSFTMPQHIKEWLFSLTNLWTSRNTFRVCLKLRHWGTDLSLLTLQTMYAQATHLKRRNLPIANSNDLHVIIWHHMSSYGIINNKSQSRLFAEACPAVASKAWASHCRLACNATILNQILSSESGNCWTFSALYMKRQVLFFTAGGGDMFRLDWVGVHASAFTPGRRIICIRFIIYGVASISASLIFDSTVSHSKSKPMATCGWALHVRPTDM